MLDKELLAELKTLIVSYVETCAYSRDREQEVFRSVYTLLEDDCEAQANGSISINDFLFSTVSLNEKTSKRKKNGVYYTDDDVVEYIVGNAFLNYVDATIDNVHSFERCISKVKDLDDERINALLCSSIFDPTCGTGQFLIQAIRTKCMILDNKLNDETLESIVTTIHGNDIDSFSVKIAMTRIFFFIEAKVKDLKTLAHISKVLKKNFTHKDYINDYDRNKRYDIIIGNPPYVEYGKLEKKPEVLMGNTYANVMYNSERQLSVKGIMAYIVPLSFVSTPRMKKIRDDVKEQSQKLFVINFADRPDCLFSSVHQKLTIVIAIKGALDCKVFSSMYYYWYKSERKKLFEKCSAFPSAYSFEGFVPKIGDAIGISIFNKVLRKDDVKMVDLQTEEDNSQSIYLNMRGTFWVKALMRNPGSREYKQMRFPKDVWLFR